MIKNKQNSEKKTNKDLNKKNKIIKKASAGRGCLFVFLGANNTIFTITYENGEKIGGGQISARTATGYRGTKKATPFAAQEAARAVLVKLKEVGISQIKVIVHGGIGSGWNAASKIICGADNKLRVEKIEAKIALPFNGCRPPNPPRK